MKKFLYFLVVLAIVSCKKDDNTTELLTRSWQTKSITRKLEGGDNITMDISSCEANRIILFEKTVAFQVNLPLRVFQAALPKLIMAPGL